MSPPRGGTPPADLAGGTAGSDAPRGRGRGVADAGPALAEWAGIDSPPASKLAAAKPGSGGVRAEPDRGWDGTAST